MAENAMQAQAVAPPPVAAPALRVLAQAPAEWAGWVERLSTVLSAPQAAAAGERTGTKAWRVELVPVPASVADIKGMATHGRIRWIVFVDSPARHMSLRLGAEPQATAQASLATWRSAAAQALAVIHTLRSQCVAFDSDEAASSPAAVAHWLSGWLGEDLPEDGWPVSPASTGLLAKLAVEYVQTDRRAMALWAELLACCSPLPGASGEPLMSAAQPVAADYHLAQAQALMAATARVPLLEAAQQGLRDELLSAQQQLREAESLREEELQAARALEARLKAEQERLEQARRTGEQALAEQAERTRLAEAQTQEARSEAELLLAQLHQVQEELESTFLQQQEARKSLTTAQAELKAAQQAQAGQELALQSESTRSALAAQLQQADQRATQERERLEKDKANLEASLRAERAAKERAEAARKQAEAEHQKTKAALQAQAKDVQEEADLLLVQLHHVQEELETHYLALQSARQELAAANAAAEAAKGHLDGLGFRVLARHSEITGARAERPHCELDLAFNDVTLGTLKLARAAVRLVEHEGRAGLALVALAEEPPPITQWVPEGEDGRGAYMLFIPADARGRDRLATLGTRNWQALRGLAALVQQAVTDSGVPAQPFWQAVAGRLCAALDAFPPRLRYDEMTVQPDGGTLAVRLEGACFGSRTLPPVALRWAPGSREAPLQLLRTHPHLPCLAAWPAGPDGLLAAELALPVADEAGLGDRLRWWAQLLPADRDLALALVDTLAAVPALLPAGADGAQRQQLTAQAARLRTNLQRSLNLGRWARRLRQGLRGQRT
jgi:chemotaxis protein histidine kinase CheA